MADNCHYETDHVVHQYIDFHFGPTHFGVENFHKSITQHALNALGNHSKHKALDIGCSVGRGSFELAKYFNSVLGVDGSENFIKFAQKMQQEGHLTYLVVREGSLTDQYTASLADCHLADVGGKVTFQHGDACALQPDVTGFDLLMATNLIDRLYEPQKFLLDVQDRVNVGGILAICSPYSWVERHTKKENWVGGYQQNDVEVTTLQAMKNILSPKYNLVGETLDVEYVIRETAREYDHGFSELSLWCRVS